MTTLESTFLDLYLKIHNCHICPGMDKEKSIRITAAIDFHTDLFIISQALASSQLRLTGVNFFDIKGQLGSTGKNLEKFLNLFQRTLYPPRQVTLSSGSIIPERNKGFITAYNTEIVQCYPGKSPSGGDRVPDIVEINNCIKQSFILDEVQLIRPKLILLMGNLCRKTFYRIFKAEVRHDTLSAHLHLIVKNKRLDTVNIGNTNIAVLPIQHPSGLNPRYKEMLKERRLIKLIKEFIFS